MHDGCLSMPCMMAVYPCHVRCLFIHAMYVACLSMPCTLPVYPCHVRCLFIHAMYVACLSMPCTLPVYLCHVHCLFTDTMCDGCLSKQSCYLCCTFIMYLACQPCNTPKSRLGTLDCFFFCRMVTG